jgi:hypothetical protein
MRKQIAAALLAAPAVVLAQGAGQAGSKSVAPAGSAGAGQTGATSARQPAIGTAGPTGAGTVQETRSTRSSSTGPATGTGVATCPPGTLPVLIAGVAPSSGPPGGSGSASQTGAAAGAAMGTGSAMAGTAGTTGSTAGAGAGTSSAACVPLGMTTPGALGTSSALKTSTRPPPRAQSPGWGGNADVAPPAGGAVQGSGSGAVGSVGGTSTPGPGRLP